ncbi:NlpC/P60 family protein [Alkalicoccus urumqiensis]|uniref:NlpC/P60 domain-containing protein n=1 Tax=Alkalicoccus urumqiensis TaxID=1548213 RepID=A0A2P6MJ38_ALKUR|nr:NlpC/P60 family protein [Alkalicoccus urumqiensis]PRO66292.1 hypothetical protein C6I21_05680 [Alkalicoccus urumqiensis]
MLKKWGIFCLAFVLAVVPFLQTEEAAASSTADQVISAGKSQLGTPYRWGGTTTSGFDCSGFTGYAFAKAGIDLPRTAAQQYQVGTPVSRSNLQPGDLVFFNTRGGISHNGIYIGGNKFIHSSSSKGVSIASLGNVYWSPRYVGAKRVIQDQSSEVASVQSSAPTYETANVVVNGDTLNTDQDAVTKDGRTLVPMRAIFEEMGAVVQWDSSSKRVTGHLDGKKVALTIGNKRATAQGSTVTLDQPAELVNGRTMVPLRFVGESLGAVVHWENSSKTAKIYQ